MNMQAKEPAHGIGGPDGLRLLSEIAGLAARRYGARTAYTVVMPNGMYGKLSFEEVDSLSDDFACWLREAIGLSVGDRVALQTPNSLVFPSSPSAS